MSFNGSGSFSPFTPGNPVVTGSVISSTAFNATIQDIAAGLSNAVTRDGQSPLTANLPAAGRKITGLGAGVVAGDSLRFEQLFSQGTEQDIASAATVDIGGLNTTIARITGTTTITSFGTNYNGPRFVRFAGILTLTHNATTLILPGGANITTAAGDRAILTPVGNPASGWQVLAYEIAALAPGAANTATSAGTLSGTVAIANGGTGQTTTVTARAALEATRGIQPITASVASNALTLTLNPTTLDFRSATLTSGTVNTRTVSAAISLVISSGSTLGTISGIASRIVLIAIDNAGTVELAAVNLAGGVNLDETGVISTTAEGGAGAADSATVIYSTTARTNVPYRVVGYVESTQATAGTWATAPSAIQGCGGQALAAFSSLGYGQTWQSVTRLLGTTYYNTTGRPITVKVEGTGNAATNVSVPLTINGVSAGFIAQSSAGTGTPSFVGSAVIPPNSSYRMDNTNVFAASFFELR